MIMPLKHAINPRISIRGPFTQCGAWLVTLNHILQWRYILILDSKCNILKLQYMQMESRGLIGGAMSIENGCKA